MRSRPRLSDILMAIAALAVLFAFWSLRYRIPVRFTFLDALLFTLSAGLILLTIGILSGAARHHPRVKRGCQILGLLDLLMILWFVGVQWCWITEVCRRCSDRRTIFERRIFSITVRRAVRDWDYPTLKEWVAADLGIPCAHDAPEHFVQQRWAGNCLLLEEVCTLRLSDQPWYPPCARDAVRSWQEADPTFARTFQERVLDHFDRDYWWSLISRMYAACPPNQLPAYPIPGYQPPPAEDSNPP